jgi:hypothetical protein
MRATAARRTASPIVVRSIGIAAPHRARATAGRAGSSITHSLDHNLIASRKGLCQDISGG